MKYIDFIESPLWETNYNKKLAKCINQIDDLSLHRPIYARKNSIIHVPCPVIIVLCFMKFVTMVTKQEYIGLNGTTLCSTPHCCRTLKI